MPLDPRDLPDLRRLLRLDGLLPTLLSSKLVATSETKIAHGLGRVPMRVVLGPPDADARVWESTRRDSKFLYLRASAAVTIDIEVS